MGFLNHRFIRVTKIFDGHHKFVYRGIITRKSPFDLALLLSVIHEVKPDLIIEIGTNYGGSALLLDDLMTVNGGGVTHTIDVVDYVSDKLILDNPRIIRYLGGWENYPLEDASSYTKILVIDDGSHQRSSVLGAMEKFAPLVSSGSYLIVEDGILSYLGWNRRYGGGPLAATKDFLERHPEFFIDRSLGDFWGSNVTFNPDGYLKKL